MKCITLLQELHANTRRTRITYRGEVDGTLAAIKCYRRPLFGLIHWLRAERRGRRLRRAGGPVPEIVYSGWLADQRCFCFATGFLEGYRPLREVLQGEPSRDRQFDIIRLLGRTMADIHARGIEQPDGNLTNFMLGSGDVIALVDEDDIRVYPGALAANVALLNLANIASRLVDPDMVQALLDAYLAVLPAERAEAWNQKRFQASVKSWRQCLEAKRAKRNIARVRNFD
ncbi:BUD32 family EKC/KEOPS complex subunit [Kineobactrum salinum]|uniref:Uncharacterized protein n=1 Tax=Kineobactrum salinum TaxID=2708301 RepID=A0A6C0U4S8_9GAMM|nr:hypothetical protein [Kineobactrum salinum]QIB65405.1 hypothetical protein G3T16_08330 [Kineobactrum salinum]